MRACCLVVFAVPLAQSDFSEAQRASAKFHLIYSTHSCPTRHFFHFTTNLQPHLNQSPTNRQRPTSQTPHRHTMNGQSTHDMPSTSPTTTPMSPNCHFSFFAFRLHFDSLFSRFHLEKGDFSLRLHVKNSNRQSGEM